MLVKALFLISFAVIALGQQYPGCAGKPMNKSTLYQNPVLTQQVSHGKRYYLQDPKDNTTYLYVAVLNGSAYQMGYAFGQLFKNELNDTLTNMQTYINAAAQAYWNALPPWIQNLSPNYSTDIWQGIGFEEIATAHFMPQRFLDELHGISDATGILFSSLFALNLFPEVIKGQCSVVGVWGTASRTGNLTQLRTLDWDSHAPMSKYPLITVYHSNEPNSQAFANVGWVGFVGSLAGFSGNLSISQKVWMPAQNNLTTIFGEPWAFVLRDVLQFGKDINSSLVILEKAQKTYQIYVGLGSNADNSFRGLQYSYKELLVYSDQNWSLPFTPAHPQMNGIMFWDETASQNSPCFGQIFTQNYGIIDAQLLYNVAAPSQPTGDTLVAVYDWGNNATYVSYPSFGTAIPAYNRTAIYLNMTALLSITVPTEDSDILKQVYV